MPLRHIVISYNISIVRWKFIWDELRTQKVFLLIETLIAKDIWDDNQLWDDVRGLVDDGMVRKRDVRIQKLSVNSAN